MTTTTIRTFTHGAEFFRHVIDLTTDEVLLQRLDTDTSEWKTLVRYDSTCDVWDTSGKCLGRFITISGIWVFEDFSIDARLRGEPTTAPEGLLDTEVTVSRHLLANIL